MWNGNERNNIFIEIGERTRMTLIFSTSTMETYWKEDHFRINWLFHVIGKVPVILSLLSFSHAYTQTHTHTLSHTHIDTLTYSHTLSLLSLTLLTLCLSLSFWADILQLIDSSLARPKSHLEKRKKLSQLAVTIKDWREIIFSFFFLLSLICVMSLQWTEQYCIAVHFPSQLLGFLPKEIKKHTHTHTYTRIFRNQDKVLKLW